MSRSKLRSEQERIKFYLIQEDPQKMEGKEIDEPTDCEPGETKAEGSPVVEKRRTADSPAGFVVADEMLDTIEF